MKKVIGISIIATSLLANLAMAETATTTSATTTSATTNTNVMRPPIKVEINKDSNTNKAKDIEYVIELKEGWNLIGLAGYKPYVLNDLFGKKELVGRIFVYNAEEQAWQSFKNEDNGDSGRGVQTVVPGMGYWIEAKQAFSISFKSNIPSQSSVYEKLAINVPQTATTDTTTGTTDSNTTDGVLLPGMPVTVSTVTYDEAFNDDGTIKDDFLTKSGTMDWNNLDLSNYSQDSWNDEFTFDVTLLDRVEFTDQVGRAYRFLPLNERGGKVSIMDGDKQIDGKFLIGHKGELEIQLKKKSNDNAQPVEPNNGIGDGAAPLNNDGMNPQPNDNMNGGQPNDGTNPQANDNMNVRVVGDMNATATMNGGQPNDGTNPQPNDNMNGGQPNNGTNPQPNDNMNGGQPNNGTNPQPNDNMNGGQPNDGTNPRPNDNMSGGQPNGNANNMAGAPATIRFDLIEIVESDTEVVLKLKNLDTKEPSKWTLTKVYDEVNDTWVNATEFLMNSVSDSDLTLTNEEWNSLTTDDSTLNTLLDNGSVESYGTEEISEDFSETPPSVPDETEANY